MGTVGLSFGSPTSGTGFDVSSTVNTIVSNLQNVETPWKNQLTALQSQDTVLSNLGTLFSTLSNDLSQLTDFQGVLAQKTGSSSDTNVLQLTSASSSATAGTHTVVVNNLAQTASGALDAIASATDTLSGSISIQVGTGTAKSITLDSTDNTLAGLASAINNASLGVTASVLTDSSGSRLSLVAKNSGAAGKLTVTSSIVDTANQNTSLAYTSAVTGKDASLTVDGITLSSATNTVTNMIPGVTFQLLSASTAGSEVQVVIGNYNSGVESAISTFVTDYNALVSAINTQQGNDSSGNAEPLFGSPTLSLLQQQLLSTVNVRNPNGYFEAPTNTSDVLTGSITIQVGSGTAQQVSLPDAGGTIADLASEINAANLGVSANVVTDSSGSRLALYSNTAGSDGALTVTSALQDTATSTAVAYTATTSDVQILSSLGITVNNDGTLTLDQSSLDSLLNSDFSGVVGFFQDGGSWGATISRMLNQAGTSSSTGILKLAQNANSTVEKNLNANIAREEDLIATQKQHLTEELTKANQILQALPSQLESIDMIYSAITGYNQKG